MPGGLRNLGSKWRFLKTQYGFQRAPLLTAVRLFSWGIHCLLPRKEILVNFRKWGIRMSLPASWRGLAKFIFVFRENYERELFELEKFLGPGKVFIDVGANLGIYAVLAGKLVGKRGRVIAFEPTAQSFAGLQKNLMLNRFANSIAFQVALSERSGKAWLYYGTDPVRNSLGKDPAFENGGEAVRTETLDDMLQRASVRRVDLIKIDAEGAEELVLRGAKQILTRMRPVVMYEVNPEASATLGLSVHGATRLLESLGYEFFVEGQRGISTREGLARGYFNVVAIPRSRGDRHSRIWTTSTRKKQSLGNLEVC